MTGIYQFIQYYYFEKYFGRTKIKFYNLYQIRLIKLFLSSSNKAGECDNYIQLNILSTIFEKFVSTINITLFT